MMAKTLASGKVSHESAAVLERSDSAAWGAAVASRQDRAERDPCDWASMAKQPFVSGALVHGEDGVAGMLQLLDVRDEVLVGR